MRDELWILGFTVFGHHWRGIKIYERTIDFGENTDKLDSMFRKRSNDLKETINSERRSEKLALKAM